MHGDNEQAGRVSVICTVKNAGEMLVATVESIRRQSLPGWEMVIVDDGSAEPTRRILRRLAAEDPRIRCVFTGGMGRANALNLALELATGEFVANIDADDPSHPERLRLQRAAFEFHPEVAVMATGTLFLHGADAVPRWPALGGRRVPVRDVTGALPFLNPINHSSVMMRRGPVRRAGGYDPSRRRSVDYDLWVRLAARGWRLAMVEMPLASKRLHGAQSFERRARLAYLWTSAQVQAQAIRVLRPGVHAWAWLFGRMAYGMLPAGVRGFSRRLAARPTGRPAAGQPSGPAPAGRAAGRPVEGGG